MALLEYHAAPVEGPYAPQVFRAQGEPIAVLRLTPSATGTWLTREQLIALSDLLQLAVAEWPAGEPKQGVVSLVSPPGELARVVAR